MTFKNIGRFQEDASTTAIAYKKFGRTVQNKYPSFTVCFEGNGLYRFNESAIFAAYGIHLNDYESMLQGKSAFQYEYDPLSRRYSKNLLPLKFKPSIDFEVKGLFRIPDLVMKASFVADDQRNSIHFEKRDKTSSKEDAEEPPFYISYQSLKALCLTRKEGETQNVIRQYDSLTLETSFLDSDTRLELFVHYPGQLFRSLDIPRFNNSLAIFKDDVFDFRVSKTTVLRKRSVTKRPCNTNIGNHDHFLLELVSNETGCVPPYWMNIIGTLSSLEICSSPEQLEKIHEIINDYEKGVGNYEEILDNTEVPCVHMFNSVVWNAETYPDVQICEKCAYLKISYLDKYYEEISELRDFGFEDFISSLGGFIGIFLGYSMLQLPQLLGTSIYS